MVTKAVTHVTGLQEQIIPATMIAIGLAVLFVAFFEQGQLLAAFVGQKAHESNYLHELFHDGRHLFGMPCH